MSAEDLANEVERLKRRKFEAGKVDDLERMEGALISIEGISSISDVAPEILGAMERALKRQREKNELIREEFDALPETCGCPEHPTMALKKLFEETCSATTLNGYFTPAYAPCSECEGSKEKARQRRFWSRRGMPERVIEATLGNYETSTEQQMGARKRVTDWILRNGTFLLLTGTAGTGKGHLAAGCLKAQGDGRFITQADMLSDLRSSYTLHNTAEVIEVWRSAEMFVIDEFGLSPGGNDEAPMLYQVLADRYDKRRPTIITSNLALPQLKEALGFRLMDRIAEDCVAVVMNWASYRTGR